MLVSGVIATSLLIGVLSAAFLAGIFLSFTEREREVFRQ